MTRSLAFTLLSALFLALSLALVYVTHTDPTIHLEPEVSAGSVTHGHRGPGR